MLQYNAAVASMKFIGQLGHLGQLDALGISRADYERLIGDAPWLAAERNRMTTVLHSIVMGSVDAMGLPRFNMPAEYFAAAIAVFVAPVNVHAACIYAPTTGEAEIMARSQQSPKVTPEQLYALVVLLYDNHGRTSAKALFERSVGLELAKVEGRESEKLDTPKKGR